MASLSTDILHQGNGLPSSREEGRRKREMEGTWGTWKRKVKRERERERNEEEFQLDPIQHSTWISCKERGTLLCNPIPANTPQQTKL